MGFDLIPFYFGIHDYVSVGCRPKRCLNWYFDLKLAMAGSFRVFGNGPIGDLQLTSEFEVLIIDSPVARPLTPDRSSTSRYFGILLVLSNPSSLVGTLFLNCSSLLGLNTSNHILNGFGKCLLCCISLERYSQVLRSFLLELVWYSHFGIFIRFVLLDTLKQINSFRILWQCFLLMITCLSLVRSPTPVSFM